MRKEGRRVVRLIAVMLACFVTAGAAGAQFGGRASPDLRQIETELQSARAALAAAQEQLSHTAARVQTGLVPQAELAAAEARFKELQARLTWLETRHNHAQLHHRLMRPVDVRFRDAPLSEAAQVISQASGMRITLDPRLQASGRVTTTATGVPVAEVLNLLAQNTRAQIAPAPDASGVVLRPVPVIELEGQRREFPGPTPPWSPEWSELGGPPVVAFGQPEASALTGGVAPPAVQRDPLLAPIRPPDVIEPPRQPANPPRSPFLASTGSAPLAITALGSNRFVVATRVERFERVPGFPGTVPTRAMTLLSLYEIRGGRMQLISTTVHDPGSVPGYAARDPALPHVAPGAPPPPRGVPAPLQPRVTPRLAPPTVPEVAPRVPPPPVRPDMIRPAPRIAPPSQPPLAPPEPRPAPAEEPLPSEEQTLSHREKAGRDGARSALECGGKCHLA